MGACRNLFSCLNAQKTEPNLRFGMDLEPIYTGIAYAHPQIIFLTKQVSHSYFGQSH
jgi:hypothetical protein